MKSRFYIFILFLILMLPTITACGSQSQDNHLETIEIETIALEHAGLTPEEVAGLHTEYDIDDNVPQYEVKFYQDFLEYEYHIHAETGEILSFDKDNN